MAIKDSDYEGTITIPSPKGIYQAVGDTNVGLNYAWRAENIRTEQGELASSYGTRRAFPALGAAIETLERFHRRNRPDDPDVLVAAAGRCIYTYTEGSSGWVLRGDGYGASRWSCVTYEMTEEDGTTIDLLLMTNAQDGMVAVYGSDLHVEAKPLRIGDEYAAVKFAVLGRHADRIWGTGATGYPDGLFYSRPYSAFDWTGNPDYPEMGGGMIRQPDWDGDRFVALIPYGGYLLAAKERSIYEVRGTDPSSFSITAAYGTDGPAQAQTICTDRTNCFFLTQVGMGLYDGSTVSLLARDALCDVWRRMIPDGAKTAVACLCRHIYYLALPIRDDSGDAVNENNAVLEYDTLRSTFMLRTGIRVKDFYVMDGEVYYTDAASPHEVLRYADPLCGGYSGKPMHCLWETAWLDLGKSMMKRDFVLRFTAEADADDLPLTLTLETDRKRKGRTVLLRRRRADYRIRIQNAGMRVKLILESDSAAGWRITGGVQVSYTVDKA